jgi:hypothetical protein
MAVGLAIRDQEDGNHRSRGNLDRSPCYLLAGYISHA